MPNWVKCRLYFEGRDMEEVRERYSSVSEDGKMMFDFGKVVPEPDYELEYVDWYSWRIKNWGTKWNSCQNEWTDDSVEFCTAWSAPYPILEEVARQMGCRVRMEYADENIGSNCGIAEASPRGMEMDCEMTRDDSARMWGYDGYEDFEQSMY